MKITKLNEPQPWEGSHGTMYEVLISFDEEEPGRVNMKTPNKWKVGDEVEITERQVNEKYGDKLKISKPGMQGSFNLPSAPSASTGGGKFDSEIQLKIDSSWAITSAIAIIGDEPNSPAKEGAILPTAKLMLAKRSELIEYLKAQAK